MQFSTKPLPVDKVKTDCLVIPVLNQKRADGSAMAKDVELAISNALRSGDLPETVGADLLVRIDSAAKRVLLISMGDGKKATANGFIDACRAAYKRLNTLGVADAISLLGQAPVQDREPEWQVTQEVLAARAVAYRFDQMKSEKPTEKKPALAKVALACTAARQRNFKPLVLDAVAAANGIDLTRDLGNLPPNICTPTYLADTAKKFGRQFKLKVDVLDEKQMRALKMGSLLSVAQGSAQPPKLIVMHYKGAAASKKPVVLVGKGITFDTGGISLKPGAGMDEMKYDMGGAAAVLGTMRALGEMKPKINVTAVIPACENMPDAKATRPGDIVTSMSGQTIEILNTDAEGRLILCDALTYCERFKPEVVIDMATLTGACIVALGKHHTGMFSNDDKLAQDLIDAGKDSLDTCWRLPLDEAYHKQLKSPFADVANIGGRDAGAITAACFLERFVSGYRWAHLDIAGTAWHSGASKGSSGRPVAMLLSYLSRHSG
ncbi:MAG: leucyl aminopeptidase [Burkholderiaceae bacterium]